LAGGYPGPDLARMKTMLERVRQPKPTADEQLYWRIRQLAASIAGIMLVGPVPLPLKKYKAGCLWLIKAEIGF
jgi:hypothetical protein